MHPTQLSSARRGTVSLVPKRSQRTATSPPAKKSSDLLSSAYQTAAANAKGSFSARRASNKVAHLVTPRAPEQTTSKQDALPKEFYDQAYGLYGLPPLSRPRSLNTHGKPAPTIPPAVHRPKPSLDALEAAVMTSNSCYESTSQPQQPRHFMNQNKIATIHGSGFESHQQNHQCYEQSHLNLNQIETNFRQLPEAAVPVTADQKRQHCGEQHADEHQLSQFTQERLTPFQHGAPESNYSSSQQPTPTAKQHGANYDQANQYDRGYEQDAEFFEQSHVRNEFSYGRHQQDSLGLFPSPRRNDADDLVVSTVRHRGGDDYSYDCPSGSRPHNKS